MADTLRELDITVSEKVIVRVPVFRSSEDDAMDGGVKSGSTVVVPSALLCEIGVTWFWAMSEIN